MSILPISFPAVSSLPLWLLIIVTPPLLVTCILAFTRLLTTLRYQLALPHHIILPSGRDQKSIPYPPVQIPYTIPFLGSALDFLAPKPGLFWTTLFKIHPRSTGACTLLLAGRPLHVLFDPSAVHALFQARGPSRDRMNIEIIVKALDFPKSEVPNFYDTSPDVDDRGLTAAQRMNKTHDMLLKTEHVNTLTSEFSRVLRHELSTYETGEQVVNLYAWLQQRMFKASTAAFYGSRIMEMHPNFCADFFAFDRVFLSLFFGIPKIFTRKAIAARERCRAAFETWQAQMHTETNGEIADPEGDVDWEPCFGSRANRIRQVYYRTQKLSLRARASIDLGFLFGLSSNAIPCAGWMLLHILTSDSPNTTPNSRPNLLPRVMKELRRARRSDGGLDIPTLLNSPLLQSILNETLRLYADVLVTRELNHDIILPLAKGKRHVLFKKDSLIMAPSWLGHHDDAAWSHPPSNTFCAERFLTIDDKGIESFTTTGTAGRLFPWGGGKSICPGRRFAKQEVLASVAMVLLEFEFELVGFVDEKGGAGGFPGLGAQFAGAGVVALGGDLSVRVRRR